MTLKGDKNQWLSIFGRGRGGNDKAGVIHPPIYFFSPHCGPYAYFASTHNHPCFEHIYSFFTLIIHQKNHLYFEYMI